MYTSLALLSLTLIGTPQAAPTLGTTVSATGIERVFEGREQPFSISRSGDATLLQTLRNINGSLAGETRSELQNPEGIFTYLTGKPAWALQLLTPSSEQTQLLAPPRFPIEGIRNNLPAIERALGGKVTLGKTETIAGRACIPLVVTDARTKRQQYLWLDAESGVTLRYVEMVNGQKDYERWFTRYEPKAATAAGTAFKLPTETKVIRGIPDAGILNLAEKRGDYAKYRDEVYGVRGKTALGSGHWIKMLPELSGFDYIQTLHRERMGTMAKEQIARRMAQPRTFVLNGPSGRNGNVSISVQGVPVGQGGNADRTFVFASPNGAIDNTAREIRVTRILTDNNANNIRLVEPQEIEVLSSGSALSLTRPGSPSPLSLRLRPSAPDAKTQEKLKKEEQQAGADGMVQSDFLDPKTGDTVSFIQLRHRGVASLLPRIEMPDPNILTSKTLKQVQVYTLTKPFALTMLTWQDEEGSYVLASTRLKSKELLELAEKAQQ